MVSTYSGSSGSITTDKPLQVWCLEAGAESLVENFDSSRQSWLVAATRPADADFQLLDWTARTPSADDQQNTKAVEIIDGDSSDPHLPLLIIIDEVTDISACLKVSDRIDISHCEFINRLELQTAIAEVRVARLLRTTQCIADRTRAGNSRAEIILQTVMKHSNDWLVVKSLDNRFLYASGKFCRAYEKTEDQIIGKNDLDLGTPPELVFGKPGAEWKGYWTLDKEVTDSGVPFSSPPLLLDKELNMYESMNKIPLHDLNGEVFALVVSVYRYLKDPDTGSDNRDKFDEDGKSTHLWDRKHSLSYNPVIFTINKQRQRAEELRYQSDRAFIAKNRFIATASHELRQPLHALGLFVAALEPSIGPDDQDLIEEINGCVNSLSQLLESLLDISKLDANVVPADMQDFKVQSLLRSLQSECLSIAQEKSLQIHCNADESVVRSDEVLLRRVLRNLIINAIKFTLEGEITLTACGKGSHVEVSVADTGIGIPADQQNLVFEEFFKGISNPDEVQQGLGLGLSVVNRLCSKLNVGFRLESNVGKGTTVYLAIPSGSGSAVQVEKSRSTSSEIPAGYRIGDALNQIGKHILVVDDDPTVCDAVSAILTVCGYEVSTAISPEDALKLVNSATRIPDAMLVDFRLSENVTGLDAIEMLSRELSASIPALIITGDTTGDGLTQITSSGYDHMHKPVEPGILIQMVRDLVD